MFCFCCRGKFGQRENLSQVEFINGDIKRFNELVFSDNLYSVSHLSLISEDTASVVYKTCTVGLILKATFCCCLHNSSLSPASLQNR